MLPLLKRPRLGKDDIDRVLASLWPPRCVMVHSSLSSCGFIKGGAATVIAALREWLGSGTLVMPTHTYCYPGQDGACEVFELENTASRVGAITNAFRSMPGVLRSLHPTHSLACQGSIAENLIEGHDQCETPCGKGTPYERLIEDDAAALMFGVTLDSYTFFHTAEDAAAVPYLYEGEPYTLKVREPDGEVREFRMWRQDMTVPRRFAETAPWLEELGLLSRLQLGEGELLWIPSAASAHGALIAKLRQDPWFLVADQSRPH